MTPDRHDETPDDAEHGVLSAAGALDTAGIGILATGTAQVRVVLPLGSEDDLVEDDDVIVDEVIVDDVALDEVATGDIVLEDVEAPAAVLPPDDVHDADVHDADEVDDEALHEAAPRPPVDDESRDDDPDDPRRDDAAPVAAADAAGTGLARPSAIAGGTTLPAPESEAPPVHPDPGLEPAAGPGPDVPAESAAAGGDSIPIGDPVPLTGAIPATRREAYHAADGGRGDRGHAVERVRHPQPEVSLTSKRLGEFDDGREGPDLLTPDRLLDRAQLGGAEPEGLWQQLLYSLSGRRINLGDSKRARARKELDRRIAVPLAGGARFVPVLSRKGGVGKTTITTLLGMALAAARDDRVIAVDANPDRGTLADRIGRPGGRTVRDLARTRSEVSGYNDISTIVARDETRLDVLASDADPRVSEAFSDRDYHDVASLAAHYYSIVLTDTGTGVVHSVMGATLELADQLVVVAGLSVDEARLASETLTWLETNGYADQVRSAVVVLNNARPGTPLVRESELEAHFRTRVRAVIRVPYDPLIGTGSSISFRDLQPATRQAARELAAAVVEGLRSMAPAA